MKAIRAAVFLGLVLLGVGFAVGTEPTQYAGHPCGSVLLSPIPSSAVPDGCSTQVGGGRWAVTWTALGLGGLLVLAGWTGYTERDRGPTALGGDSSGDGGDDRGMMLPPPTT